jgi:hypothetical protein
MLQSKPHFNFNGGKWEWRKKKRTRRVHDAVSVCLLLLLALLPDFYNVDFAFGDAASFVSKTGRK